MKLLKQLYSLLFKSTDKPMDEVVGEKIVDPKNDKVGNFNKLAPQLFGARLKELGYELRNIENFEYSGFLWSTHHFYENDKLNLTIDIQQAPYYTDYGFSIFLFDAGRQDQKLLCNVPHELQDRENNFLLSMRDKFFSDPDVISLLKGENWKTINHLRIE
jgi:hypothetical protein